MHEHRHLRSFRERRLIISPRGERQNHKSEGDSSLNDVKVVCRRAGLGVGTVNILGSVYDLGLIFKEIFRLTGGFDPKGVNTFKKARSRFLHEGTTVRFQVKEEEGGCVIAGAVMCEGVIEAHLELTKMNVLGAGDFEVLEKCRGKEGKKVEDEDEENLELTSPREEDKEEEKDDDDDEDMPELEDDDDDEVENGVEETNDKVKKVEPEAEKEPEAKKVEPEAEADKEAETKKGPDSAQDENADPNSNVVKNNEAAGGLAPA